MRFDRCLCEPFRAWNRVEPRPRREDLTQALQAQIHDPLWMLTRQWQFGEFQGEDTGSAIFAKLAVEVSRLSMFQLANNPAEPYNHDAPFEAKVEREAFPWDLKTRVQAGVQWLKFVDVFGARFNTDNPSQPQYTPAAYQALFQAHFPLPDPEPDLSQADGFIDHASLTTCRPAHQFLTLASGRGGFDGVGVYLRVAANPAAVAWPMAVNPTHHDWLAEAASAFYRWFNDLYHLPDTAHPSGWNPQQLEYQCLCAAPKPDGTHTVLKAEEYYQGHLDWYAFDIDPNATVGNSQQPAKIETKVVSVIPTEARFGGMPNPRWWEFEDGHIDFGNVQATNTDLAKSVLVEFSLMYSNDWFLVPLRIPVGSLSEVKGIVILDVFGQRTLIDPAGKAEHEDWTGWSLFHLTERPHTGELHNDVDTRLFLPPVVVNPLASEHVEAVSFIRDEALNLVWAVETRIPDYLGQGQDGHVAGRQVRTLMETLMEEDTTATAPPPTDAPLTYQLSNTVPENWIPFLPVHTPGDTRSIHLQRGSMPRFIYDAVQPVRPKTSLLRPDVKPYFLFEEEVGRAGTQVTATFQRTRWCQGETFTWYGLQKITGRGEGSSGLQFDTLKPNKK
ncbi:MAG: hypothetical protein ACYDIB_00055 [Desulfobulbia bacterium]|nr:MAG: hypothetical protein CVU58_00015 [Deltaproteobacteria bacterium HGW-Deltaproteobacteria-16]